MWGYTSADPVQPSHAIFVLLACRGQRRHAHATGLCVRMQLDDHDEVKTVELGK